MKKSKPFNVNDLVTEIQKHEKLVSAKIPTLPYSGNGAFSINTDGSLRLGEEILVIDEAQRLILALVDFYFPDGV